MRRLKWRSEVELWVCSQRPNAEEWKNWNRVIRFVEGGGPPRAGKDGQAHSAWLY